MPHVLFDADPYISTTKALLIVIPIGFKMLTVTLLVLAIVSAAQVNDFLASVYISCLNFR